MSRMTSQPLRLPKKVLYLPDIPKQGKWNVASRIAGMLYRKYKEARKNPNAEITLKEIMIQANKNLLQSSDNNLLAHATPKQKADAFGLFMDKVLEDTQFHDDFRSALNLVKMEAPDKFLDVALKMQKMRHPTQKDVNVNVDVEVRETIYERMQKQYNYSEMIDEAQVIEEEQIQKPRKELISQLAFQQAEEDDDEEDDEDEEEDSEQKELTPVPLNTNSQKNQTDHPYP